MTDLFDVYQFFPDDSYEHVGVRLTAEAAVNLAKQLTESVGARIGTTRRIIITDDEDFTVFEWLHGPGVTFPTREECEAARRGEDAHDPR